MHTTCRQAIVSRSCAIAAFVQVVADLIESGAAAAVVDPDSDWRGHDMRQWPPTNLIDPESGQSRPLSWLFMPLILDALGMESLAASGEDGWRFSFERPAFWSTWVEELRGAIEGNDVTSEAVLVCNDALNHIPVGAQDELLHMHADLARRMPHWGIEVANGRQDALSDLDIKKYGSIW